MKGKNQIDNIVVVHFIIVDPEEDRDVHTIVDLVEIEIVKMRKAEKVMEETKVKKRLKVATKKIKDLDDNREEGGLGVGEIRVKTRRMRNQEVAKRDAVVSILSNFLRIGTRRSLSGVILDQIMPVGFCFFVSHRIISVGVTM
jgi:hypothetical protein